MNSIISGIYRDRIKFLRHRIEVTNAILLIFIMTISLLFLREHKKLELFNQKLLEANILLELPLADFKNLYDGSQLLIEEYTKLEAVPYYKLCSKTQLKSKIEYYKRSQVDLIAIDSSKYVKYASLKLREYSNDLGGIVSAHNNGESFYELDKLRLFQLVRIFLFDNTIDNDSLFTGISIATSAAKSYREHDFKGKMSFEQAFTDKLNSLGSDAPDHFRTIKSFLISNSYIREEKIDIDKLQIFNKTISSRNFDNISAVKNDSIFFAKEISRVRNGENVNIPFLNMNVSLTDIVVYGGIINVSILLYVFLMVNNLKILIVRLENSIENQISKEEKEALFFGLDYQIRNKSVFVILNSLFFISLNIVSVSGFYLISDISPKGKAIIIVLLIMNIVIALFISIKIFDLRVIR